MEEILILVQSTDSIEDREDKGIKNKIIIFLI